MSRFHRHSQALPALSDAEQATDPGGLGVGDVMCCEIDRLPRG